MRTPKGNGGGAQETVTVHPGNRLSLIVFTMFGALVAADAGRVDEIPLGGLWDVVTLTECDVAMSSPGGELRFEKIAAGTDLPMPSIVRFEWHPDTGELSFTTQTALTLPEKLVTAASAPKSHRCE